MAEGKGLAAKYPLRLPHPLLPPAENKDEDKETKMKILLPGILDPIHVKGNFNLGAYMCKLNDNKIEITSTN